MASTDRLQACPDGPSLSRPDPGHRENTKSLKDSDPDLYLAVQDVLGALHQDLLPPAVQESLFHAMNAAVQRSLIAETSGLDASVLVTFKQQLSLVDSILRRTFNSDGTLAQVDENAEGMSPKDVLNMSLKVSQMMVKELPKVYSMDRVQRMEKALLKVMGEHLTREQQEAFLEEMDAQKGAL